MRKDQSSTIRVGMISLGCSKNLVDSEVMLGLLKESGFEITPIEDDADILIINTCSFINAAKQESMDAIRRSIKAKKRKIIIAGCLAQRYGDELKRDLKGNIHAILGTGDFHRIVDICRLVSTGSDLVKQVSDTPDYIYDYSTPRILTTPRHIAYVKIAEGCDNCCSYCVIPKIRGRYRSRSQESIVSEAENLAKSGVKEIVLIAQDTTSFGNDLGDGSDITGLLKKLVKMPVSSQTGESYWIRILYGHPAHISDDLLKMMAYEEKICSYVDVPLQHINDEILQKMDRRTTKADICKLISKTRRLVPGVTLRTSFIVGFPGETDEQFNELMQFIEEYEFDHIGVFAYSAEDGTPAFHLENHIPETVKNERLNQVAQLHEKIALKLRQRMIGRHEKVLIDSTDKKQAVGRTQGQAPEIDDVVIVVNNRANKGEFAEVEILDVYNNYDLIGSMIYNENRKNKDIA